MLKYVAIFGREYVNIKMQNYIYKYCNSYNGHHEDSMIPVCLLQSRWLEGKGLVSDYPNHIVPCGHSNLALQGSSHEMSY